MFKKKSIFSMRNQSFCGKNESSRYAPELRSRAVFQKTFCVRASQKGCCVRETQQILLKTLQIVVEITRKALLTEKVQVFHEKIDFLTKHRFSTAKSIIFGGKKMNQVGMHHSCEAEWNSKKASVSWPPKRASVSGEHSKSL